MRILFNRDLVYNPSTDVKKLEEKKSGAIAKLCFDMNKKNNCYDMISNNVEIGLANSAAEGSTSARLNIFLQTKDLQRNHFRIKYDDNTRMFSIALFAPARVNEEKLNISTDQSNPVWHRLKQKSSITCGLFQVNFESLK